MVCGMDNSAYGGASSQTVISLRRVLIPQWTHRDFEADDPWSGARGVRFALVVCSAVPSNMVHAARKFLQTVGPESNAVPGKLVVCLARGDTLLPLPVALRALWRDGEVQDADLPRLLQSAEPLVKSGDLPHTTRAPALLGIAIAYGILGPVAFFGAGYFLGYATGTVFLAVVWALAAVVLGFYLLWRARQRRLGRRLLALLHEGPGAT
jgi:hypothetical protein